MKKKKPTLSVCMIVKNEEKNLPFALKSVEKAADEIIIVDTGSVDKTVEAAKSFGAKVYDFEWIDDFSAARNESLKHATSDWILVLDADEFIGSGDIPRLKKLLADKEVKAYACSLLTIAEKEKTLAPEEMRPTGVYHALRLFRNHFGISYQGKIHENTEESVNKAKGRLARSSVPIYHWGLDAHALREERNFRNLRVAVKEAKASAGASGSLLDVGRAFFSLALYDEAMVNFKKAMDALGQEYIAGKRYLRKSWDLYEIQMLLVGAYHAKKDYRTAALEAAKILQLAPESKDIRPLTILADSLCRLKQYPEAEKILKVLIKMGDISPFEAPNAMLYPLRKAEPSLFSLVEIFVNTGRYSEAVQELKWLIKKRYRLTDCLLFLILCYFEMRCYEKVVGIYKRFKKEFDLSGGRTAVYTYLGISHYYLGKYAIGREWLEKVLELAPSSAKAHLYLGHIYMKKKDRTKARMCYKEAANFNPAYKTALDI